MSEKGPRRRPSPTPYWTISARLRSRCSGGGNDWPQAVRWRPGELDPERLSEMRRVAARCGFGVDAGACQRLDRRRAKVGVTARDDAVEVLEIRGQVEREAVAHDRAVQLDADRRELPPFGPHAGETRSPRLGSDSQLVEVCDQRRFEARDVVADRDAQSGQVEDRVADQLAGPVIRGLAAANHPDHVDSARPALVVIPQNMLLTRGLAHREDVRVLEQQQRVVLAALTHPRHHCGLEVPGLSVPGATQPAGSYAMQPEPARPRGMTT